MHYNNIDTEGRSKSTQRVMIGTLVAVVAVGLVAGLSAYAWYQAAVADDAASESTEETSVPVAEAMDRVEAVTTSHELATAAGTEILEAGGTAADASIAIAAVLSVVEPWFSSSLGGGTWALYYDAETGDVTSVDAVGPTGSNASVADYEPQAGASGMHQSVVPGAWSGWLLWLEEYGTMELDELLAPAIRIAREGYEVSENMENWLDRQDEHVTERQEFIDIYKPDGDLLRAGDTVYQHSMADTFESLVAAYDEARVESKSAAIRAAHEYFYTGPLAQAIVDYSDEAGGYLTMEDFAAVQAELREPLRSQYNDSIEVLQNPPNSHGITMLLALNNLRNFDFTGLSADDPEALHVQAEAIKLAFADRHYHIGDPELTDVPTAGLLDDEHTERQQDRIDMDSVLEWPITDGYEPLPEEVGNTTTFHVLDMHGNGAAVTTSLGAQFYPVADTGIHMNNRMRFLSFEEGNPNELTPQYKVRHTSNPYMAFRDGELFILGGNTGADTQPQAQVQQFLNVAEFGMTAQEAVSAPRFVSTAWPSTTYPHEAENVLKVEGTFAASTITALEAKGHTVEVGGGIWGDGNIITIAPGGTDAFTGTEPRIDSGMGAKKIYKADGEEAVEFTP